MIKLIKSHQPDIIGTQEGLHHMVTYLKESLTDYAMIGQGRNGGKHGEYNAVFYKKALLALIDQGQFWLSESPDVPGSVDWNSGCTRICTWSKFANVNNLSETFMFYNTHLDHASQIAREKGSHLLGTKMKPFLEQGMPIILTGDFNSEPENKAIKHLEELGLKKMQTEGKTFHDFTNEVGSCIDYIFVSRETNVMETKVDRSRFDGGYPSDHFPVIGEVEIKII